LSGPILLDTCAAIWMAAGQLEPTAQDALERAGSSSAGVWVSPITAWEIGLLVSRNRIALHMPARTWFGRLSSIHGTYLSELPPDVLIAANELPGDLHRDPADRILAATARTFGYRLMTRDRPLLAYAEAGFLRAVPC
jgi:PIN domain nuclease of toxin-antitoxin system